ncbi:barwin-like endoglucanase, partial [Clavulina sp. PMI_390]
AAAPSHGAVRPHAHRSVAAQVQERGYAQDSDLLEPYATYAERYQLFDCEDKHNTTFWDGCCHPLLADESESNLPDSCWANPTTSTHKTTAPATTTTSSGSGGSWRTGGFGTYFYQEGNAGACGNKNSDSAKIVAIDIAYYGNTGEVSSYCGKKVRIVNTDNGKTVDAEIADVCPTCKNDNCLDMSLGTFEALS